MYDIVRRKLDEFYRQDDVVSDNEVISLFDLINAFEIVFKDVYWVLNYQNLVYYINCKYSVIENIKRNLNNLLNSKSHKKINSFYVNVLYPETDYKREVSSLSFHIKSGLKKKDEFFVICKQNDANNFYFNYPQTSEIPTDFVLENLELIDKIFYILESFQENFDTDIKEYKINDLNFRELIVTDLFEIKLDFRTYFNNYEIKLANKEENRIFEFEWSDRPCLKADLIRNKDFAFKKIMIPIKDLNVVYQKVINMAYSKDKVKSLKR